MGFGQFLVCTLAASIALPRALAINYLVSFGDSYTQTGFSITSTKPSVTNPLGNPAYPGWTTSGGPNWLGYLVKDYNATLTYNFNFASGGATVNASLVKPYQPTVKSLIDQVEQFKGSLGAKPSYAQWEAGNALFGIWLGVNDVGNSYGGRSVEELVGKIIESYVGQVGILWSLGARKFVFLNVPPINLTPLMLSQSASARETEVGVIKLFNNALATKLADFFAEKKDATYVLVDTHVGFNAAIQDPKKYGARDATCYNSDGKTCLWYNDYHPGTAIQREVARGVVAGWKESGWFKDR